MQDKALQQKEVASRELKVLKLAGAFAALNHPRRLEIDENDFSQAINVVNHISKDFDKFLKHKAPCTGEYISLLDEMVDNLGKKYLKTQFILLATKHGFKQRDFRQYFNDEIEILKQLAEDRCYMLSSVEGKANNATYISLSKKNEMNVVYEIE